LAARTGGLIHCPAYGAFTAASDLEAAVELAVLNSLREFRDEVCEVGWQIDGGEMRRPDVVWIDCGWLPDVVATFVRESGPMRGNRYLPVFGRGRDQVNKTTYRQPQRKTKTIRALGEEFFLEVHRDRRVVQAMFNSHYWRLKFQSWLAAPQGTPGSLTLYSATQKHEREHEHARISRHWTNERFVRRLEAGRGVVEQWEKHGQNHWLDAAAMAAAGLAHSGLEIAATRPPRKSGGGWWQRESKPAKLERSG